MRLVTFSRSALCAFLTSLGDLLSTEKLRSSAFEYLGCLCELLLSLLLTGDLRADCPSVTREFCAYFALLDNEVEGTVAKAEIPALANHETKKFNSMEKTNLLQFLY